MTQAANAILNRTLKPDTDTAIHQFLPFLEEIVNYGTTIFESDINTELSGDANIPPLMLFRHFLETLDGITILIKSGNISSSKIILRALFETSLFLEYIFEKDTENRCLAYLVADLRRQVKSAKRLNPNREESKQLYATVEKEGLSIRPNENDIAEITQFIKSKEQLLDLKPLSKISHEFDKKKRRGIKDLPWYGLFDGPGNIEALSSYLGKKTIYEILYRKWSGSVHATDVYLGKVFAGKNEDEVHIVQLRNIDDLSEVVLYATLFSFPVYRLYVSKRVPGKLQDYAFWYLKIKGQMDKFKGTKLKFA